MRKLNAIRLMFALLICNGILLYRNAFRKPMDDSRSDQNFFVQSMNDPANTTNEQLPSSPTTGEDHIFFMETSCAVPSASQNTKSLMIKLSPSAACAIESAAKANPNYLVYFLHTCPLDQYSIYRSGELVKKVFGLPNVRLWHQSMDGLCEETPLEEFCRSRRLAKTFFPIAHASDVMRVLVLWKYGGTYFDTDFIFRRPVQTLGKNFVGAQSATLYNNAALAMGSEGIGHEFAQLCLHEIAATFRGYLWAYNGPYLVTRVLNKICGAVNLDTETSVNCHGFLVHPSYVFYAVPHNEHSVFHSEADSHRTMLRIKKSFGVHLWNSMSFWSFLHFWGKTKTTRGAETPIHLLQKAYCPLTSQHLLAVH